MNKLAVIGTLFLNGLIWSGSQVYAQKEATYWYFGNGAGLDFSSGSPRVLKDGALYTNEGCAAVSDKNGKLLFYTDGITVWNKHHQVIASGKDLGGHYSSTQSALIIPQPGHPNRYYLFTTDEKAGEKGLRYSVIDMNAHQGNGEVIKKNVALLNNTVEKLTAVGHPEGKGIWVIAHEWNSNAFYAYLVTKEGVGEPVISNTGASYKDDGSGKKLQAIGYMKTSPDGKWLACASERLPAGNVELFTMDGRTGKISLHTSITTANKFAYGVSFSPDNSKLYVSFEAESYIVQYDLKAGAIERSAVTVAAAKDRRYGALQLGPDGKIYIATSSTELDVIQRPNATGTACNYQQASVYLGGKYATFGLPNFPDALLQFPSAEEQPEPVAAVKPLPCSAPFGVNLGKDTTLCGYDVVLNAGNEGKSYLWNTGATTQQINARISGKYWVTVTHQNCSATDTINVTYSGRPASFAPVKEFIPDNGGFNSLFDYIINDVDLFELKVTNKRGKVVFSTTNTSKKWDGKVDGKRVAEGVYNWEVNYRPTCPPRKPVSQSGKVNVLKK